MLWSVIPLLNIISQNECDSQPLWAPLSTFFVPQQDPASPFSQLLFVSAKPSWTPMPTSCIKAPCAEERVDIKGGEPCVVAGLLCAFEPPAAADLRDKAFNCIEKHRKWWRHASFASASHGGPSWFSDALFFTALFLLSQLLLLLINPNHLHDDGGNTQARANRSRLGWIY